jgi:hypothetical protein
MNDLFITMFLSRGTHTGAAHILIQNTGLSHRRLSNAYTGNILPKQSRAIHSSPRRTKRRNGKVATMHILSEIRCNVLPR